MTNWIMAKPVHHLKWGKNIERKGENAGNQHFLLSPHCFPRVISTVPLTHCIYF